MKKKTTALIDADSILYIAGWDKDKKGYIEDFNLIFKQSDSIVSNILIKTKATNYLAFLSPSQSFRKKEFESYKSNRNNLVRPGHIHLLKEYLINKWGFIKLESLEADDAVNICKNLISDSVICSPDKDVLHLEGEHYNYKTDDWISTNAITSIRYFWEDMITGQPGDGVKGLVGKGKAHVKKIFDGFLPNYRQIVFEEYIKQYGEYEGIKEFYKNYKLLKILDRNNEFEQTYKNEIENPLEVKVSLLVI